MNMSPVKISLRLFSIYLLPYNLTRLFEWNMFFPNIKMIQLITIHNQDQREINQIRLKHNIYIPPLTHL